MPNYRVQKYEKNFVSIDEISFAVKSTAYIHTSTISFAEQMSRRDFRQRRALFLAEIVTLLISQMIADAHVPI